MASIWKLSALLAFFAFALHGAPASAAFQCAKATAATPQSDEGKIGIWEINWKISQVKSQLGAQDGIMCEAPDGRGKFWHFQHGSVYWSPDTGAMAVFGLIRQRWAQTGWEKGPFGYPMSDEIDTYDGLAKVSKFQGGQMLWRPWTNKVTEVRTNDLLIDLPTPVDEEWKVIQANGYKRDDPSTPGNEGDSHVQQWVYCYDFSANSGATGGKPFLSTADARVALVREASNNSQTSNVVVQALGLGRYASSLHVQQNSYSDTFGSGKPAVGPTVAWSTRPIAKSGEQIAKVGKTGTGGDHIHFCVTTAPDMSDYAPFESVPYAFRNYEVKRNGKWEPVTSGRPLRGEIVRRKKSIPGGAAAIKEAASSDLLNFGTIAGALTLPAGKALPVGELIVTVNSAWGEPLRSVSVPIGGRNVSGPFKYSVSDVPNYTQMTVTVAFKAQQASFPIKSVSGTSVAFNLVGNATATANVSLTTNW